MDIENEKAEIQQVVECPECFETFRIAEHSEDWTQTCPNCEERFEVASLSRADGWQPIKSAEDLPKEDKQVLWQFAEGDLMTGYYSDGRVFNERFSRVFYVKNFIAWRNLPAAYRGEI